MSRRDRAAWVFGYTVGAAIMLFAAMSGIDWLPLVVVTAGLVMAVAVIVARD